jgi:hypothetical protein
MSARPPLSIAARVKRWHVRGAMPKAPLGVSTRADPGATIEEGDAMWLSPASLDDPASPAALAALLPDPIEAAGAIVVVSPQLAGAGLLSKIFGRSDEIPRAVRGSALLSRGYGSIEGGVDPASGLDLIWGSTRSIK